MSEVFDSEGHRLPHFDRIGACLCRCPKCDVTDLTCALRARIGAAARRLLEWGMVDGGHHKQWVMDQVLRQLLHDEYDSWIVEYNSDEDYADWDVGIAP